MNDSTGVATLSGGIIEDCSAQNGGAVYMTAGTFTISGNGKIQNCSATQNGGAVYLGGGEFIMNGGTISDNGKVDGVAVTQNGGAVYLGGGTFTMSNGTISGNSNTLCELSFDGDGNLWGKVTMYTDLSGDAVNNGGYVMVKPAGGNAYITNTGVTY